VSKRRWPSGEGVFLHVPEPRKHRWSHCCNVPETDYPVGTIWRCSCGRRWRLAVARYDSLMDKRRPDTRHPLIWVRRRIPWPQRPLAEALTAALEDPRFSTTEEPDAAERRRESH
jgi:hypothetical protein